MAISGFSFSARFGRGGNTSAATPDPTPTTDASSSAATPAGVRAAEHRTTSASQKFPPVRDRLRHFFIPGAQLHSPPATYGDNWINAAKAICNDYMQSRTKRDACFTSPQSFIEFSRMLALAHEFKHLADLEEQAGDLPSGQRILHEAQNPEVNYPKAIVSAYLKAAGVPDVDAVLDSFRNMGTGAIHRQHIVAGATASNALGAAQVMVPDITVKLILSSVRLATQAFTSAAVIASGNRRLRTAATEDVFPLGRADTAGVAKEAPDVLFASRAVLSTLPGAGNDLDELRAAMEAFRTAQAALSSEEPSAPARQNSERARDRLNVAFARICHKLAVKEDYKAASENAKVEWRGNERNLYANTTGTVVNLAAASITIMSPALLDAAITGGVFAGTTALAALVYMGYQLSAGPSKDGEAKARRAIIALTKLTEVLDPAANDAIRKRAEAYERHRDNEQALLDALDKIASEESAERSEPVALSASQDASGDLPLNPESNWREYVRYKAERHGIESNASITDETVRNEQLQQHDARFYSQHAQRLTIRPLIDAWKPQIQIQMETAHRLLAGKLARELKRLFRLQNPARSQEASQGLQDRSIRARTKTLNKKRNELMDVRNRVKQLLCDLVHFELARNFMKQGDRLSGSAFAGIRDEDVRNLFCGSAEQKIKATYLSKLLTAGEAERYTLLNAGANALGIGMTLGLQGADVQIIDAKRDGTYSGPVVNDFKLLATQQAGATPSAPLSTGYRASFQKREMKDRLKKLDPGERDQDPKVLTMKLPVYSGPADGETSGSNAFQQQLDTAVDSLIDEMYGRTFVPEGLNLVFGEKSGNDTSTQDGDAAIHKIFAPLEHTTAFHRVRYKEASISQKAGFIGDGMKTMLKQTLAIYGGLITQAAAQRPLKTTRQPLNEAKTMVPEVRNMLAANATAGDKQSSPVREPSPAGSGSRSRTPAGAPVHGIVKTSLGQVPGSSTQEPDLPLQSARAGALANRSPSLQESSGAAPDPTLPSLPKLDIGPAFSISFDDFRLVPHSGTP